MDNSVQKKKNIKLPVVMAVIPAVLTVLEWAGLLLLSFAGNGGRNIPGYFAVGILSILGFFALPFFCLIFEIIGLVSAIRRKSRVMIIILAIELVITVLASVCAVMFLSVAMNSI